MISIGTFITDTFMPIIIFMVAMNIFLLVFKLVKKIPGKLDFILTAAVVDGFIIGLYMMTILSIIVFNLLKWFFGFIGI